METMNTTIRTAVPERRPQPALRATTPAPVAAAAADYAACETKVSGCKAVNPFVGWGVFLGALAIAAACAAIFWKDLSAVL